MKASNKEVFYQNETIWEELGKGLSRQIVGYNDTIMMVKVKFDKGAIGELHHHMHSQVSYVAAGKFELTINNNTKVINLGDSFIVAPNLVHGVKCLKPGILIDVFNPVRQDFL